ncbi:MAG: 3'-5' exonuclease [Pseudomonadota bacterium]
MNWGLTRLRNRMLQLRIGGRALDPLARKNLHALEGLRLEAPARDHSYVVMDLETTGLDPTKDRVVSVGAFRVVEGRVRLGEVFSELCNPGRDIPVESIKVHAIVPDMIRDAREAWVVFEDFLAFIGTDILVAHYAAFDTYILDLAMKARSGFALQNLVLDTVEMCRSLLLRADPYGVYSDFKKCSLDKLADIYELEVPERHTALGDALTTAMIFQRFLQVMEEQGSGTLRDLIRIGAMAS